MIRVFYRLLFALFVLAGLSSSAQSSDVGVWIVDSQLSDSTVVEDGDEIEFDFEEQAGYGISFNHFWTDHFSTELALQTYDAELTFGSDALPAALTIGELNVLALTAAAQWHFNRDGRFAPYAGGGIAHIGGDFEFAGILEEEEDEVTLQSELTWTASVGANIRLTRSLVLAGEMKYIPWDAREEGDLLDEALEVDPITFAAGVRFRF